MFNMITGINELKTLMKHISFKYNCRFHGKKCNSDQWWNNLKCQYECKRLYVKKIIFLCEKDYIWNHAACSCENGKY